MLAKTDRVIFSATDLINYLGCRHAVFLDLTHFGQPGPEIASGAYEELLKKKGMEHEQRHLACLKDQGKRIAIIDPNSAIDRRVAHTLSAMEDGAEVIYQGALLDTPWIGYADFLMRVSGRTKLGGFGYEVVDTKLARTPRPKHVVQLCVYSELLGIAQGLLPSNVHLVLGDSSQVSLPLSQFLYYAKRARRGVESFAATPPIKSLGEPCGHCGYCRWNNHCSSEWAQIDHLSLIANITRSQIAKLNNAGVETVRKLSTLPSGVAIPSMQTQTLSRLTQQARLQIAKRDTGEDRYELLEPAPGKGFARMPKPDPGDLFFDVEGDPLVEDGLTYLFGFVYTDHGERMFKPFWAHSRTDEKHAFEDAVDFIVQQLTEYPNAYVYHYASYEETALKRLSVLHGTKEDAIDNLLRQRKLVDLYRVVREGLRVSEPRYSLKN